MYKDMLYSGALLCPFLCEQVMLAPNHLHGTVIHFITERERDRQTDTDDYIFHTKFRLGLNPIYIQYLYNTLSIYRERQRERQTETER